MRTSGLKGVDTDFAGLPYCTVYARTHMAESLRITDKSHTNHIAKSFEGLAHAGWTGTKPQKVRFPTDGWPQSEPAGGGLGA